MHATLGLAVLFATLVWAAASKHALAVCSALSGKYPEQVADSGLTPNLTLNHDYEQATTRYWSAANADLDNLPACAFFPTTAQEVAYAVVLLNKYSSVPWAVKGGGHNPNVGFSSTAGGILLAMESMSGTVLDDNNLAHVGPGARWGQVATALEPANRVVVTGRLGDVGAAGLTLGGGLSFLSTEYGMAADNVVNFEVVTAAGEIVNANKSSNNDLFYALKGGGNQFAIVTSFVMQTYPIGQVWGGTKIYSLDKKDALLKATHNLASNYHDPKAAVIMTFSTTLLDLVDVFVVFYFYNSPDGPGEILSEFNAIPALIDQTSGPRSFADLVNANSEFSLYGMRYLIRGGTIPSLPSTNGTDLFNFAFDSFFTQAKKYELSALDNFVFSIAFQPVPHQLAQASISAPAGVNVLGLDPATGDHIFLEYDISWLLETSDALASTYLTHITQPVQQHARSKYAGVPPTNYQRGDVDIANYNPIFLNDAMYNQDPLASYGKATYTKLKQIQKSRDPKGFFSKRTGGFKFS